MTLRSRLMIGLIATASFPLISFGTDTTSTTTPRIYSETEIAYIRGMSCDTFSEAAAKGRCLEIKKQVAMQAPLPPHKTGSGSSDQHPPMPPRSQSGAIDPTNSGEKGIKDPAIKSCGSCGVTGRQIAPNTGTGADIEREMKGLTLALGKLTPAERTELQKIIREYLTSKGITLPTPEVKNTDAERKGWDGSVKGKKTATEIQAERAALLAKAKAKREAMRKEYVGHVTLMK